MASEYRYSDDLPTWSNAYIWPTLVRVLERAAAAPRRVFELGCGNGATSRMLAGLGYEVVAVDPSTSGIEVARQHESANLHFETGSTTDDLAGRHGRFPVVVSLEVIEHCPSAVEFITAFKSVLAPGGLGIISTPYHGYLKNLLVVGCGGFDRHFDPLWEGGHVKFFSIPKLTELLRGAGFEGIEFHRVGRVPVVAKSVIAVVRAPQDQQPVP